MFNCLVEKNCESRVILEEGSKGEGRDPVSRTNLNQIHVSRILETAEFTNHMSFLAIFTGHGLIFALFTCHT